jgi:hypothetical protein
MKNLMALAMLALAGCASADRIYGPDGQPAYVINCAWGAPGNALSSCYSKAMEVCPRGYAMLDHGQPQQQAALGGSRYGFFGAATTQREPMIAVRCK